MRRILIFFIRLYKTLVSPMMANHCRFHPSCSSYAIQAIEIHGGLKGSWMTLTRLLRCHPFHPGGYDPVPEKTLDHHHNRRISH